MMLSSHSLPSLENTVGKSDGEGFEVFPQDPRTLEVVLHHRGIIETAQGALKSESVPAVQNTNDVGLVTLYKRVRDIVRLGNESLLHNALLPDERCPVFDKSASVPISVYPWLDFW